MEIILFQERQQFRHYWTLLVYIPLLSLLALFAFGIYQQTVQHQPFGDNPAPTPVLVGFSLFILLLIALFYFSALETIVTSEGIGFRWSPFQTKWKFYPWNSIQKVEIYRYGFVGYGIRLTRQGVLHNVSGNNAVKITLTDKRSFSIGTQQKETLEKILRELKQLA